MRQKRLEPLSLYVDVKGAIRSTTAGRLSSRRVGVTQADAARELKFSGTTFRLKGWTHDKYGRVFTSIMVRRMCDEDDGLIVVRCGYVLSIAV